MKSIISYFLLILLGMMGCGFGTGEMLEVSVESISVNEGDSGTTAVDVSVNLSAKISVPTIITYTIIDGTATNADGDYTGNSGTLIIPSETKSGVISLTVTGDTKFESDETIQVDLLSTNLGKLGKKNSTVTILNDDPVPAISINDQSVSEGDAGTAVMEFTVSLVNPSYQDISVDYTVSDGTALEADNDYTGSSGTLNILAGNVSGTVTVDVSGDITYEPDETLNVGLSNPQNSVISDSDGTGTILNDDPVPAISINDQSVSEGDAGTAVLEFTVSLSNPSSQIIQVTAETADGTAEDESGDGDYISLSPAVLTIPSGNTSGTVSVDINGDLVYESDETLSLVLSSPQNATITDGSGTGIITNDDDAPTLAVSDAVCDESDGVGTVTITVTMTSRTKNEVTVDYTTGNGTASAGSDYTAVNGSFNWPAGTTGVKTFTIDILEDLTDEWDETVNITLSNAQNAAITDNTALLTITDNDAPPVVNFTSSSQDVFENDFVSFGVSSTLQLSRASGKDISISFAYSGTASEGMVLDYSSSGTPLTIPAGDTSADKLLAVIFPDDLNEYDETVIVTFDTLTNVDPGVTDTHTITILDFDNPPTVRFSGFGASGTESDGSITFSFVLMTESGKDVTIPYTVGGTATGGGIDYSIPASPAVISAGDSETVITITIHDDNVTESNETIPITMGTPVNAIATGPSVYGVTIIDDDPASTPFDALSYVFEKQWGGAGYQPAPINLTCDNLDNIYVICYYSDEIKKYSNSGTLLASYGTTGSGPGEFLYPGGMTFDSLGNIYVADGHNDRVQVFDSTWTYITSFGTGGSGDGQFVYASGICIDSNGDIYVSDRDNHRVQKFNSGGIYLLQWGSQGNGNGQFQRPTSIAVDSNDDIYVYDAFNTRIQKFDSSGTYLTQWAAGGANWGQVSVCNSGDVLVAQSPTAEVIRFTSTGSVVISIGSSGIENGQLSYPCGVCEDSAGNIFVGENGNNRIQKFDPTGLFVTKWSAGVTPDGLFNYITGIDIDESGDLFVVDQNNDRMQKTTNDGTFILKWGQLGSGAGEFWAPYDAAANHNGRVYVADFWNDRIQVFDLLGIFLFEWGGDGSGDGQFSIPKAITVNRNTGDVYVVDTGNSRIQVFSSNGTFIRKWGSFGPNPGEFLDPQGIALDPDGYVYVSDFSADRIQKFDSLGTFITEWGTSGTLEGELNQPRGLVVDPEFNIYVVEDGNDRIQKFYKDGNYICKWGVYGKGPGDFNRPFNLAIDDNGNLYITDLEHRIQKFNPVP